MQTNPTTPQTTGVRTQSPEEKVQPVWEPGVQLADRYRIVRKLGQGGIGVVFQVEHLFSGKLMAAKLLHPHIRDELSLFRLFRKEVETISRLSHPHAVSIFDSGILRDGSLYLVLEYIPGIDLHRALSENMPLSLDWIVKIGIQACHALEHAHSIGIFHRNIKPANVMLSHYPGEDVFIRLLDFGITTAIEEACRSAYHDERYCAPETLQGQKPSPQVDIYGLGAVLYELLTKQPLWKARRSGPLFPKHPEENGIDVARATLQEIVSKAVNIAPEERYESIKAFAKTLEQLHTQMSQTTSQTTANPTSPTTQSQTPLPLPEFETEIPAQSAILTRDEWEHMNRSVRWQVRIRWLGLLTVLLLLAGYIGKTSYNNYIQKKALYERNATTHTQEIEPNNTSLQSTHIPLQQWIQGELGKAIDSSTSDIDWFHFTLSKPSQVVQFQLIPPKMLDLELTIYQLQKAPGSDRFKETLQHIEIVRSSKGLRGQAEIIPGYRLPAGTYHIAVRESIVIGETPQESLGPYRLMVKTIQPHPHHEIEPNEQLKLARHCPLSVPCTGKHDHPGDIDYFSFDLPSDAVARAQRVLMPKTKKRPRFLYKLWKDAPLYRIVFHSVPNIEAKVYILDEHGKGIVMASNKTPIETDDSQDEDNQSQGILRKSTKEPPTAYLFPGTGRYYVRISNTSGYNTGLNYRFTITPSSLR